MTGPRFRLSPTTLSKGAVQERTCWKPKLHFRFRQSKPGACRLVTACHIREEKRSRFEQNQASAAARLRIPVHFVEQVQSA